MLTTTLVLALASLAFAQKTLNVQVGAGGKLVYDPPFVSANPGDIINFTFLPKAHTLTQSSFNTPCIRAPDGFDTGFVNVSSAQSPMTRQFTVPQGNGPLWFYCRQTGHCGQGMVFAINAPASGNTFAKFQAMAIAQNGTATATPTATVTVTSVPSPIFTTVTATVTWQGSTYTTTYASYAGTPPPTPAANPVTHKITVGADGQLVFNPPNITASINDTVLFEFHAKNHTTTQSNFNNPCVPLVQSTGNVGFDTGFANAVSADATTFPTFSIKINTTAPIWGYCAQTGHCVKGMVFSINAVESGPNNFSAFKALALASNSSSSTGSSTGTGAASPSTTGSSGAISIPASVGLTGILAVFGMVALVL